MAKASIPRSGSLQFWPRKRAQKIIPSVNWNAILSSHSHPSLIQQGKNLMGFLCYKSGMLSAFVKDLTPHALSKDKKIIIPVTFLDCPPMKILAVRFFRKGKMISAIINQGDRELKRLIKLSKKTALPDSFKEEYDDLHVLAYSLAKQTSLKKTPDLAEIALFGDLERKMDFVKEFWNKEIRIHDVFKAGELVDSRGLTTGKGLKGPVQRFGIGLKTHKTEKGVRRPGSLGPWHPAHVTFRVAQAGQLGMFSRIIYNQQVIAIGNIREHNLNPQGGFPHYGMIQGDYLILRGSVQGPKKRCLLLTYPLRPNRKSSKKKYEFLELR